VGTFVCSFFSLPAASSTASASLDLACPSLPRRPPARWPLHNAVCQVWLPCFSLACLQSMRGLVGCSMFSRLCAPPSGGVSRTVDWVCIHFHALVARFGCADCADLSHASGRLLCGRKDRRTLPLIVRGCHTFTPALLMPIATGCRSIIVRFISTGRRAIRRWRQTW